MLVVAGNLLDAEANVKAKERETFLADKCPPVELPYSRDELLVRRNCTVSNNYAFETFHIAFYFFCGFLKLEASKKEKTFITMLTLGTVPEAS